MPLPSVGLTHLRVRSQRKHTFEERLAALTVADEVERLELAAQWRNSNRPSTSGGTVGGRSVVGEDDHPPAAPGGASARGRSATHTATTAAQQELMIVSTSAQRRIRPSTTTTVTTSEVQGERRQHPPPPEQQQHQHAFLSPPSTRVRGPLSYVEDPRVLKRAQNPYYVYFASDVHDMEIAQQLAATSPSLKKKQKGGGGGGGPLPFATMLVPNASSSNPYHDLPTVASVSGSISQSRGVSFGASGDYKSSHRYDDDDVPVIMVQSHRPSVVAGASAGAGGGRNGDQGYLSLSSVHTAASASSHNGGGGGPGRRSRGVTIAPNNDDWDDDEDPNDDEEDFLDDLGFVPSLPLGLLSMAHQKSQQQQQQQQNLHTSFLSVHPPNANVHLPTFGGGGGGGSTGSSRRGSLSVDRSQKHHASNSNSALKKQRSSSSSVSRSKKNSSAAKVGGGGGGGSLRFGNDDDADEDDEEDYNAGYDDDDEGGEDGPRLPDHHIDRARLKQFKSRYAPHPVDVAQLKPKCAILHVKLEKLNQRMKAEDDEFAAYRDAYLKKLRL